MGSSKDGFGKKEKPDPEKYAAAQVGHDIDPGRKIDVTGDAAAEKSIKILRLDRVVDENEPVHTIVDEAEGEFGDRRKVVDAFKEAALKSSRGVQSESLRLAERYYDEERGKEMVYMIFDRPGRDNAEFIVLDPETEKRVEAGNIEFIDQLPGDVAAALEKQLRQGKPGEKGN